MQIETPSRSGPSNDHGSMPVPSIALPSIPVTQPHHIGSPSKLSLLSSSNSSTISRTLSIPPPPKASTSALSLTYSAHTSIPKSSTTSSRVVHHQHRPRYHPLHHPVASSSNKNTITTTTGTASGSSSTSRRIGFVRKDEYEFREEDDEDAWFFSLGDHYIRGEDIDSSSNAHDRAAFGDTGSLLLFRERQRRYYWIKQVRERERVRLEALKIQQQQQEEQHREAEEREHQEKRAAAKRELPDEDEQQKQKKRKMDWKMDESEGRRVDDVEMEMDVMVTPPSSMSTSGTATPSNMYSRTVALRSPSPDRHTAHKREVSSGEASTFWGIGGVGPTLSARGKAPASLPSPCIPERTTSAGFMSSGGIGKGSGRVDQAREVVASPDAGGGPGTKNINTAEGSGQGSAPAILVNGLAVVKTTGATGLGARGRPRGLWRARGSGPVPTFANNSAAVEGKTQIGGFVFGSGFSLGSSGYQQLASQKAASGSSKGSASGLALKKAGSSHQRVEARRRRNRSIESLSGSSSSSSSESCSSEEETRRVEQRRLSSGSPQQRTPEKTSSTSSSSTDRGTMPPAKSFDYAGYTAGVGGGLLVSSTPPRPTPRRTGSTTPTRTKPPADEESASDGDLDHKRKKPLATVLSQQKRQKTSPASADQLPQSSAPAASTATEGPGRGRSSVRTRTHQHHPMISTSNAMDVVDGNKSSNYVTRSKVMDTSSLAGVDPSVVESRRASESASVGTNTSMHPPPSPSSGVIYDDEHRQAKDQGKAKVTYEDWEDLREVWTRCLEVVDVEEPAEMLPLLRGVIHECSRFLEQYEDPSLIFLRPNQTPAPETPLTGASVGTLDAVDVEMLSSAASIPSFLRPSPTPSTSAPNMATTRRYHHYLCQNHEHNRNRTGPADLPTAFHSLLGTALFLFGNLIGENPQLALEGEPRTSTVYHLYALDVFEVGENIPAKTLIGSGVVPAASGTTTSPSSWDAPPLHSYTYSNVNDVSLSSGVGSTADCCALPVGMKEDWHMAVTCGRTLVSLAENLLEREKVVEGRQKQQLPGAYENPAAFLLEDFRVLGLAKGGYFEGTGGMGMTLNGIGQLVPTGNGNGLSAFHSPSSTFSPGNRGPADDYWGCRPESTSSSSHPSTSTTPHSHVTPTSNVTARTASQMYPSASFLSPSFIAASRSNSAATSTYTSSSTSSPTHISSGSSATYTGTTTTPGAYDPNRGYDDPDPRRFWKVGSPFVVIRSRMPPVTRRMSLGVGGGVSVDELMTLAVDQFSRGIFHMPRSGVMGDDQHHSRHREGSGASRSGSSTGHKKHHHHSHSHHHSHHRRGQEGEGGEGGAPFFFSRASHLNTIATQVLFLAEKLDAPESRYKWGKYADSVFEQMKLEENPGAAVVMLASESFAGALNYDVEERIGLDLGEDEEEMDVDGDGDEGGTRRRRHHRHHRHHGRRHRNVSTSAVSTVSASTSEMTLRPPTSHPDFFLHNNTNPDILKARGRCCLVIGAAKAEEELEGLLEEAYQRQDAGQEDDARADNVDADGRDSLDEGVRRVLESEDAVEVRERLEEAVNYLERARELWRKEVWGPRARARDGARRRKAKEAQKQRERRAQQGRDIEMEVAPQKERESGQKEERERVRKQQRKEDGETAEVEKEVKEKPVKVKRRGIGKIAADNKRSAKGLPPTPLRPGSPFGKGKERAFISPTAITTPSEEKEAEVAMIMSPGVDVPPHSPLSDSSLKTGETPSTVGTVEYFPPVAINTSNLEVEQEQEEDDDEEELLFRAEEEEEEMEEKDLAQLLAQALYMLGDLAFGKKEKEELYKRATEEADRAGKTELVEKVLGEENMHVD